MRLGTSVTTFLCQLPTPTVELNQAVRHCGLRSDAPRFFNLILGI